MIRNERQYKITNAEVAKLREALQAAESATIAPTIDPLFIKAEIDGLRSQLEEMVEDLESYERLRDGIDEIPAVRSVQDIPRALIQTRIRAGLTQEDLAQRVGLKPQQIQRYEASDYASANLSRVSEIAEALDISLEESDTSIPEFKFASMMRRLKSAGLPPQFVSNRLLPKRQLSEGATSGEDFTLEAAAQTIERIYGWHPGLLLSNEALDVSRVAASQARFKVPARANGLQLGAYVVYAHYLALLLLQTTKPSGVTLSSDPTEVRRLILQTYGAVTFEAVLQFVWNCGIPVLTLNDRGTFHGACWRHGGRNVIVLKQQTRSAARWIFDLLHEYFHAAHNPQLEDHPVVEEAENSETRRKSPEEIAASSFAGNVMLDNKAQELAERCVQFARGSVERLKDAVAKVARQEGIDVGALAQYMAFRLSAQGVNWWGAATNLQAPVTTSAGLPRELLLKHSDLTQLNPVDRGLLLRSLEPQIIAFAGKRGSGKTAVSEGVAKVLNWPRASFGEYLRAAAKRQGISDATENLQELGAALAKEPDRFCDAVLTFSEWEAGEPLVVEGIRHQEILESLRRKVAPLEVRLVYLDIDEPERVRRLNEREPSTTARMQAVEGHSTESQVKDVLSESADFHVSTREPSELVIDRIVDWIQSGNANQTRERVR
jgi:transcriptional regulator with XRE-family HTH domain/cytidylate kinase